MLSGLVHDENLTGLRSSSSKSASLLLMFAISLFMKPSALSAERVKIHFDTNNQRLTVNLKQAPLKIVMNKIEEESQISVEGENFLANNMISVEFKNLPLEEGMERLLKNMNYSLVFGNKGNLLGVSIIGAKERKSIRPYNRRRRPIYRRR